MAMIEKVCECGKGDCEYHGGEMYSFKHNSLQINPECRTQFKEKDAKVFIVNTKLFCCEYYYAYSMWGGSYGRLYKKDDVWCDGILYNEKQYKLIRMPYRRYHLTPVHKVHQYEVAVVVGNQVFYNHIWDLRKFKLNMNKMFKNVVYTNIRKEVAQQYKYAYDLFEGLDVDGSNAGFDNMCKTMGEMLSS